MSSPPHAPPTATPPLGFVDQRGGMKAMGLIMVVMGSFAFFTALYTLASGFAQLNQGPAAVARGAVTAGMYGLAAVVLATAGVGSLRGRRWSRPAMLVVTGTWALRGALGLVTWVAVGPDIERAVAAMAAAPAPAGPTTAPATGPVVPVGPPVSAATIRTVTTVMLVVFGVLLPGGFFWFYARPDLRRTVDHFDPEPAWTDPCPTPVLALAAWLAVAALFALGFSLWGVFPLFGRLVDGPLASAILIGVALVLAGLSVAAFRRNPLAWWATALLIVLFAVNWWVTFSRVDPLDVHRLSGATADEVRFMERMDANSRPATLFTTVLYAAAGLAYLAWVRRYFRQNASTASREPIEV
jgi:hypothetical protein